MTEEQRVLSAVIAADEPLPKLQAWRAASAEAFSQGLVLRGKPIQRAVLHKGKRFLEFTWDVVPELPTRH